MKPFKILINNELTKWRYDTFWTKEPETIEFIKSFAYHKNPIRPKIFIDIGANIGIYSLYAASLYPEMKIYAIEPDINNYIELVKNIRLNKFYNIIPLNCGIGAYDNSVYFSSSDERPGNSSGKLIDRADDKFSILSMTLNLLAMITHHIDFIKIDVDGGEFDILFGMISMVDKIQSMLIEIDRADKRADLLIEFIQHSGYTTNNDFNKLANHSRFRREKGGIGNIENIIFTKI